jgi:hypothetical protein
MSRRLACLAPNVPCFLTLHKPLSGGLPDFATKHREGANGLVNRHPTFLNLVAHLHGRLIPDDAQPQTPKRTTTQAASRFEGCDQP